MPENPYRPALWSWLSMLGRTFVVAAALSCFAVAARAQSFDVVFDDNFDSVAGGPKNANEAARFLTQATYGPTLPEIERLRGMSYDAWLTEQASLTPTLHLPLLDVRIAAQGYQTVYNGERIEEWVRVAINSNDQLRQRVAYALSQVFVISDNNATLAGIASAVSSYYDVLVRNALGNYRTLMEEVAKHPTMGIYLSSLKNRKSNQAGTIRPDENFARENMQLFSIGLLMLNPDGTLVDGDAGTPGIQPVPTYTQETIKGFAKIYTGWNYASCKPTQSTANSDTPGNIVEYFAWYEWDYCPPDTNNPDIDYRIGNGFRLPMKAWEVFHNKLETKQLLNYPGVSATTPNGVLAAGGTAQGDLTAALDNIFNHPNVGPFVSRLLIQRLVTSNPTPAYVGRVAAVFNDNGSGVRGDLKATVRAILLDPEARDPLTQDCVGPVTGCVGKLREPAMRATQFWRAMNAKTISPQGIFQDGYCPCGQNVLRPPTVFNFYLPSYAAPGADIAGRGLVSPEFQIAVDSYLVGFSNYALHRIMWGYYGSPLLPPNYTPAQPDLTREMALAHEPAALLGRLNLLFLSGRMSATTADIIGNFISSNYPFGFQPDADVRRSRVQDATFLLLNSPEYMVEK